MENESGSALNPIGKWLHGKGFDLFLQEKTGDTFLQKSTGTCIIIDTVICTLNDFPYVDYTSRQNNLMAKYNAVFRYLYDPTEFVSVLQQEIQLFLDGLADPDLIKQRGGNREVSEPDPTRPEAIFEDCFLEAFGDGSRSAIKREFPYIDFSGSRRFVDYAVFSEQQKFALELNGESFHHPCVIGPKRYKSQLYKQNSLVADGFKVFRWSIRGMRDRERFILELQNYLGYAQPFQEQAQFKLSRKVETFQLKGHQMEALERIETARKSGQNTFLLVLPTGTGKTEVFISDLARLKAENPSLKALIIVPSRKLRIQTIERLNLRLPAEYQGKSTTDFFNENADFVVQTAAYLQRHYYKLSAGRFDYIVVDEAHHTPAEGLRKVVQHFTPEHLLGVTATPDRTDNQNLEEIFGEYEAPFSLKEAIQKGLVPPIRCFRIKSNVDLSEVRFNGREYIQSDLQKTLIVPSRDLLIVDIIKKYFDGSFANKEGVIFCVGVDHAKRMAKLLNQQNISARAVDGKDVNNAKKSQKDYQSGEIRFLCTCDLLTEGWDAPNTELIIMARPTFSKVLYTQQLGRGLRHYKGKEALYVLDVVDNYGAKLQSYSLHSLLKIPNYKPFDDVVQPDQLYPNTEILLLDGLFESERRIEPVDILTFEEKYGHFLNDEQMARALFISTDTLKKWVKKGDPEPDENFMFGRRKVNLYHPDKIKSVQLSRNLKEHTPKTRAADFKEFLESRNYTFSYKIIFLLAFLKVKNERFEADLNELLTLYRQFYQNLLDENGKNEKDKSPYNRSEYLTNEKGMQQNLLKNPFEKFERKRFFYQCKDLKYIALDPVLIKAFSRDDFQLFQDQMKTDLTNYYEAIHMTIEPISIAALVDDYSNL